MKCPARKRQNSTEKEILIFSKYGDNFSPSAALRQMSIAADGSALQKMSLKPGTFDKWPEFQANMLQGGHFQQGR
jgi:hypothetical protein